MPPAIIIGRTSAYAQVEAVELLQNLGHRMVREPHEPLLRWEDNTPLTRDHIQAILERGAVAVDLYHRIASGRTASVSEGRPPCITCITMWTSSSAMGAGPVGPFRDTSGRLTNRRREWPRAWHGTTPRFTSTIPKPCLPPLVFPMVTQRAEWGSLVHRRPCFFGSQRNKRPARHREQGAPPCPPWVRRRGEGGALMLRPRRVRPGRRLRRSRAASHSSFAMACMDRARIPRDDDGWAEVGPVSDSLRATSMEVMNIAPEDSDRYMNMIPAPTGSAPPANAPTARVRWPRCRRPSPECRPVRCPCRRVRLGAGHPEGHGSLRLRALCLRGSPT